MRDCCNRRRAFTHLDFSPMKGIFCIQQYLFVFSRKVFEMSLSMVDSAEINIFEVCRSSVCVCVCVFFPFILDIKFVGRTSRGHTGGRSHRIFNPPSFCGACLDFSREKDSAIPFPRRP